MEKHKLGREGHKVEKNPEVVGERMKKAVCDNFDREIKSNSLCKKCK